VRELGNIRAALTGGEEEFRDLISELRAFIETGREIAAEWTGRPVPPGRRAGYETIPRYNRRESLRIAILSKYYAKLAGEHERVIRFRADILGGRLLSEEDAVRFVRSPAAQHLSVSEFSTRGLDPANHVAEVIESERFQGPPFFQAIRICTSDGTKEAKLIRHVSNDWEMLPFDDPAFEMIQHIRTWRGSVLHDLYELGKDLSSWFAWQHDQATKFVLCGITPRINPLHVSITITSGIAGTRRTITLTAADWVSNETIGATYRPVQREVLGGDNRLEDEKGLTLFWFVEERRNPDGKRKATWRALRDEWIRDYPRWRIEDVRNFTQRYKDVRRALLYARHATDFTAATRREARLRQQRAEQSGQGA
jgi:hypothetical protein